MPDQVDEQEKTRRSNIMLELNKVKQQQYEESWMGKEVEVLFEEIIEKEGIRYAVGHTKEYLRIIVPCGDTEECEWLNQMKLVSLIDNSQIIH